MELQAVPSSLQFVHTNLRQGILDSLGKVLLKYSQETTYLWHRCKGFRIQFKGPYRTDSGYKYKFAMTHSNHFRDQ